LVLDRLSICAHANVERCSLSFTQGRLLFILGTPLRSGANSITDLVALFPRSAMRILDGGAPPLATAQRSVSLARSALGAGRGRLGRELDLAAWHLADLAPPFVPDRLLHRDLCSALYLDRQDDPPMQLSLLGLSLSPQFSSLRFHSLAIGSGSLDHCEFAPLGGWG
jgi:hypothetical protein